jgi:type II secretory pathway pseudopilin PulG
LRGITFLAVEVRPLVLDPQSERSHDPNFDSRGKMRGLMNFKLNIAATTMLAVCIVASYGQSSETIPPVQHHTATHKTRAPKTPTVEEQIQALRQELQGQIDSLKTNLADKDAQLQRAQQAAADAQAATARTEAAASAQQQAVTDNAAAVTTLQSTVTDLKGNQASLAATVSDETAKIKKDFANPTALRYKGITITPGGFMAAETVYRQKATGADIPTALSSIPFNGASSAQLSEFFGSGRQSRVSMLAEGKTNAATYRGYVEADFLGVGTSSNNNQSNSYVLRQRVVWADATLKSGFSFQGGQMWSLAAERAKGLSNLSGDVKTPQTIDPNYVPGFVWTRQYGFRVVETMKHVAFGISLENPQTITGGSSCTQGTVTCLYGASTTAQSSSYNAVNATYSYNLGPDIIAKVAVDPGWGHYEAFAIGRFPHYELWPSTAAPTVSKTNSLVTGGFGGSFRAPVFGKYGDFGVSGLYGWGVGRYGDTTLADVTFDATGTMMAIQNTSALSTLELHPTKRLVIYGNFGEDFAGRLISTNGGANSGYALMNANNSGCNTEVLPTSSTASTSPANCNGVNKFVQEFTGGFWYDFYKGPAGRVRLGAQYAHLARAIWGGTSTPQVDATENQFYTSFRYYLP